MHVLAKKVRESIKLQPSTRILILCLYICAWCLFGEPAGSQHRLIITSVKLYWRRHCSKTDLIVFWNIFSMVSSLRTELSDAPTALELHLFHSRHLHLSLQENHRYHKEYCLILFRFCSTKQLNGTQTLISVFFKCVLPPTPMLCVKTGKRNAYTKKCLMIFELNSKC